MCLFSTKNVGRTNAFSFVIKKSSSYVVLMYELQAYRNGIATACTAVNYRGEVLAQFLLKLDTLLLTHARDGDGNGSREMRPDETQ